MEGEPIGFVWTPDDLRREANGAMIARGLFLDGPEGLNIQNTGNVVKWAAVKGDVEDWAIYYQNPRLGHLKKDWNWVVANGDKLHNPYWINKLVPSNAQMLGLYRH